MKKIVTLLIMAFFIFQASSCEKKAEVCAVCGRNPCVCDQQKPGEEDPEDNPGEGEGGEDEPIVTPSTGELVHIYDHNLVSPEGVILRLYGVNFQTPISWEYNDRLRNAGVPLTADALKAATENNIDELLAIGVNHIRCHLTPCDFTDAKGNLVENAYLDALDHLVAKAAENNIYVSVALLNHMGQSGSGSWASKGTSTWIHDPEVVAAYHNYVRQLVNRTNKYTGEQYKNTKNIAILELSNEPSMYSYSEIKNTKYYDAFKTWAAENGKNDDSAGYSYYRMWLVRNYIDSTYDLLKEEGDNHLICWSLNWHRYYNNNNDIFSGVADSKTDVVAFCNYPGQDLAGQQYWDKRFDFTTTDFSSWFKDQYNNYGGYGWTMGDDFKSKVKIVYEFETFFNQSAYLYAVQATYFAALGAQCASMWTYTMAEYSQKFGGSHFLSATCTPGKAVSFIAAHKIFEGLDLYCSFSSTPNEITSAKYVISKSHNAVIYSDKDYFYHSAPINDTWNPLPPSDKVKHIAGIGSSPIVEYDGTGFYRIDQKGDYLYITIMPDVNIVGDQFRRASGIVTELDYTTTKHIKIKLADWQKQPGTIYKIENDTESKLSTISGTAALNLKPGRYVIVPDKK